MGDTTTVKEHGSAEGLALLGVAGLGYALWLRRDALLARLGTEGLADPGHVAAGWHLNFAGWALAGLLALSLFGGLRCTQFVTEWRRWTAEHRTGPVPVFPVGAAGAVIAGAALLAMWPIVGLGWAHLAYLAVLLGALRWGAVEARRWREAALYGQLVDQVAGHGYPGRSAVRADVWRQRHGYVGQEFPTRIEVAVGPGWRGSPAELAELSRYAADMEWPGHSDHGAYRWVSDHASRRVVGTFVRDVG